MIFLDTNVVSEMMKKEMDEAPRRWLDTQDVSKFWLTVITVAELRYGAKLLDDGSRKTRLLTAIDQMIAEDFADRVADFTIEATADYAEIAVDTRRIGKARQPLDLQIAALARLYGAALATRNVRHFEHTGVDIIDPWSA
jgi:predicted nucleic acid-binding protein